MDSNLGKEKNKLLKSQSIPNDLDILYSQITSQIMRNDGTHYPFLVPSLILSFNNQNKLKQKTKTVDKKH